MKQPVPSVTHEDVMRIVSRDFAPEAVSEVIAILEEYGTRKSERESARVRLAVLKLSSGNPKRVRTCMNAAKSDYRDVLSGAEYPAYSEKGNRIRALSPGAKDQLVADDWIAYQEWLRR